MYPVGTLLSFGHALPDEQERTKFLQAIETIGEEQRFVHRGVVVVLGGSVRNALQQAGIVHLSRKLASEWLQYTDPADLSGMRSN